MNAPKGLGPGHRPWGTRQAARCRRPVGLLAAPTGLLALQQARRQLNIYKRFLTLKRSAKHFKNEKFRPTFQTFKQLRRATQAFKNFKSLAKR